MDEAYAVECCSKTIRMQLTTAENPQKATTLEEPICFIWDGNEGCIGRRTDPEYPVGKGMPPIGRSKDKGQTAICSKGSK